jgi:hypothetical protein
MPEGLAPKTDILRDLRIRCHTKFATHCLDWSWGGFLRRRIMQFSRVITPVEDIQIWNASSDGFSFVISYESRSGPGLQGKPGFVASWRPIYQNRFAVKVIGSPFKTLTAAEEACEVMLGHLITS